MYSIIIEPLYENTEKLQNFVEDNLPQNCIPKVAHQILIIVDEIYSNIVKYSNASNFKFKIYYEDCDIWLTFIDNGKKYNPLQEKKVDITLPKEKRGIGSLGVYVVKKLSDSIEYEYKEDRNIIKIRKRYLE